MTDRRPRLFIVEFGIANLSGHHFNQVWGFQAAARDLGLESITFLGDVSDPGIIAALGAEPFRAPVDNGTAEPRAAIDALFRAADQLDPLWAAIEAHAVGPEDVVLFASSRTPAIAGLAQWLARLPPGRAPAIFIRLHDPDFFDGPDLAYGGEAWFYRLACRLLRHTPGQASVALISNNSRLAGRIERACGRRTFFMPMPKFYGAPFDVAPQAAPAVPTVYVHVNMRTMLQETLDLVGAVGGRARVVVKICADFVAGQDRDRFARQLDSLGASVVTADQEPEEYLSMIGRADITVLPYPCDTYRANPSGVLCEAAALGKAVIAPSGTWAADQIIDGAAAGVLFDSATRGDAGRATLEALDDLDNLSARARELAPAFRQNNSCRNNLDLMLALAGRRLDMRPACRPGEPIDFSEAYESACYLTEGWGQSEPNAGIWTLGAEARMLLIMDSAPAGAMRLRAQVTPFVAACHPALTVRVEVNGSPVGAWAFTVGESGRTERDAIIPAALFDGAQARVTLHIDSPSSPLALGLSGDGRLLGLMAHTLTLDAVDPTAPG